MEFDLFDPEALNLNEISSMLQDSSFNVGRENASMSSGNSTLIGNTLDALEGSSIWSPTTHNSSGASFSPHSSSPPSRSFENTGIWSPSYHNSSSSPSYASSSNSPPERLLDALNLNGPSIWSHNPTSPTANNPSSTLSRSSSSPPPGLANLANLAFNNNSVLNMKQTIQALNFLQELQEASQNIPWDGARANENASLTAALQQHLLTHLLKQSPPTPTPPSPTNDNLLRSVRFHRENAGMNEPRCTWSGQLPARNHKNPIYSCKVFLGGVPYEVSISTLLRTFRAYGNVKLEWPGKEDTPSAPKGYAYLIYENERQVKTLLQNCIYHYGKESNWYYKISSKRLRFHSKDIQVIPWAICDSNFVRCQTTKLDPQKTIFVGALHGMINAEALAMIMHELFGGVVYAGIDTDRHKYPIGSGRVTFNNSKSYMKAVSAEFVEIRSSKFTKKVQVDPYLEDATCSVCRLQQGPYFCRSLSCFRYFCRTCFEFQHSGELFQSHRPLMRNASRQPGSSASSSA